MCPVSLGRKIKGLGNTPIFRGRPIFLKNDQNDVFIKRHDSQFGSVVCEEFHIYICSFRQKAISLLKIFAMPNLSVPRRAGAAHYRPCSRDGPVFSLYTIVCFVAFFPVLG